MANRYKGLKTGDVIKYKGGQALYLIIEIKEVNGSRLVFYKHPQGHIYSKEDTVLQRQTLKVGITARQFSSLPPHHKEYSHNIKKHLKNPFWICDNNFWVENEWFFLSLFSTHYPFNEYQLKKYKEILVFGAEYSSNEAGDSLDMTGLIFNKHIIWTESLRELYYCPSLLIYEGETNDVFSLETDFNKYPIICENIFATYREIRIDGALRRCSNAEEMMRCYCYIETECEELEIKLDKSYLFGHDELLEIITETNLLIASSEHFYNQIMGLIGELMNSFNINRFLNEALERYERD